MPGRLVDLSERQILTGLAALTVTAALLLTIAHRISRDTTQEASWTTSWSPTATATPT